MKTNRKGKPRPHYSGKLWLYNALLLAGMTGIIFQSRSISASSIGTQATTQLTNETQAPTADEDVIKDPELAKLIETVAAGESTEPGITNTINTARPLDAKNLKGLQTLFIPKGYKFTINSLEGLQYATNLKEINFRGVAPQVSANSGKITSLEPLADLTGLQYLALPEEGIQSINPLNKLNQLIYVDLSNQEGGMTGELPKSWASPNLWVVEMQNNHLSGSINDWDEATNLVDFSVSNSNLTGQLPESWSKMMYLDVGNYGTTPGNNQITGSLPTTWKDLQYFVAAGNNISGSLPSEWSTYSSLSRINLKNNNLTGDIPTTWSNLKKLALTELSGNHLTSDIDSTVTTPPYNIGLNQTLDGTNKWVISDDKKTATLSLPNYYKGFLVDGNYSLGNLDGKDLAATKVENLPTNFTAGFHWTAKDGNFTGNDGSQHSIYDYLSLKKDSSGHYYFSLDLNKIPTNNNIQFNINFEDMYTALVANPLSGKQHSGVINTNIFIKADAPKPNPNPGPTPTPQPTPTPNPAPSPAPTPTPDNPNNEPGIAEKGAAVYALKKIYLYQNKDFTKGERITTYVKKPRINRPMFVVTGFAKSNNGTLRYKVRDVNHHSKTAGKRGYITANWQYVRPVYYQSKHKTLTVINPTGVNAYQNKNLSGKVKNFKQGTKLKVKGFVTHNLTTRYVLMNGTFITGNRKLVIAGNFKQPQAIKTTRSIYRYNNVNFGKRNQRIKKGTTLQVKKWEYSHPYSTSNSGVKRYAVKGGYITANPDFVKVVK
ncbi:DUF5776 domain-containing protein [Lentilactobacillus otakiensis]|uniref:DUF5776 domain-containing protein n=1 Tax=Lentilactobacillus otakiensis TaxID=481720 RepID=UPI003D173F02